MSKRRTYLNIYFTQVFNGQCNCIQLMEMFPLYVPQYLVCNLPLLHCMVITAQETDVVSVFIYTARKVNLSK